MATEERVSKSKFKAHALEYFRKVEESGRPLVITDRGRPALRLIPYAIDAADALAVLRGSVLEYEAPTEPVGAKDWEALQ